MFTRRFRIQQVQYSVINCRGGQKVPKAGIDNKCKYVDINF